MDHQQFQFSTALSFPAEDVFDWHLKQGAVQRLLPPWRKVKIKEAGSLEVEGSKVELALKIGPFWKTWELEHTGYVPGREFMDVQIRGLFSDWRHRHRVLPTSENTCDLIDDIEYALLPGLIKGKVHKELVRYFNWKHRILGDDLATYRRYPSQKLRILLSGASGFIGGQLKAFLQAGGHEVVTLVCFKELASKESIFWNPVNEELRKEDFEGFDAVINLAGANIAGGHWTKNRKEKLFLSRCRDTWLLSQVLQRLHQPPKIMLSASAVGIYGNRGDEVLTEASVQGKGFLAELCTKWEEATQVIEKSGARVVLLRFGNILSPSGGMLRKMLPLFQWGLGGKWGTGKQFLPWVALDDVIGAIYHALMEETLSGPLNIVAPFSVAQEEFVRLLAKELNRPAHFHMPAFLLRAVMGEMADASMLASMRAQPKKLLDSGYLFRFSDLESAFHYMLS